VGRKFTVELKSSAASQGAYDAGWIFEETANVNAEDDTENR
jgi:hypothetical protein